MKILACSHRFLPDIGGIETSTAVLAAAWVRMGHDVTIVSRTPGSAEVDGLRVERSPDPIAFLKLVRGVDVVWQNNPSLPWLAQARTLGARVLVTHQTWLTQPDGSVGMRERAKAFSLQGLPQVAISRAIARHAPGCGWIIPNPFDAKFLASSAAPGKRIHDLAFVGRMVSDKGIGLLLSSLELLERQGVNPSVVLVGDGPERAVVENWIRSRSGRSSRMLVKGALAPEAVAEVLASSGVLAVPSIWEEPFGIVALEGIAAGCTVVASDGGGLPEAVGPCGLLARRGDAEDFGHKLAVALTMPPPGAADAQAHLSRFTADRVATDYAGLFEHVLGGRGAP
jgi:glycogen synthase